MRRSSREDAETSVRQRAARATVKKASRAAGLQKSPSSGPPCQRTRSGTPPERALKPRRSISPPDASQAQTDAIASADENTQLPTDDGDMQASMEWASPRRPASPETELQLAPLREVLTPTGELGRAEAISLLEEVARDTPGELTLPEQAAVEAAADWKSIQTPPAGRAAAPEQVQPPGTLPPTPRPKSPKRPTQFWTSWRKGWN